MKVSKTLVLKIILAFVITLAAGYSLYGLFAFGIHMKEIGKDARQRRMRLLCEIDHRGLLDACREISKQFVKGDLKKSTYRIRKNADLETVKFPQVVLDLEPTHISIYEDGRVMVEMLGGMHHLGVYAYPEDYEYKEPLSDYGDKKLIDGLWYYDDGYHEKKLYYKKIDALLQKGK
jgi:hypothetical protein